MEYLNQLQNKLIQRNIIRDQNILILGGEVFRNITGYENYAVSNFGRVKNTKSGRTLKPGKKNGYYFVNLCKDNCTKNMYLHRLIINAFCDNPENKKSVDHIDNNRTNNNLNNLHFCTNQENQHNRKLNSDNTSGVKGVYFNKNAKKWHAQIVMDGIKIHLGFFDNIEDAKQARIKKANEAFGIFTNYCEKK
jgi:hypothetical protein